MYKCPKCGSTRVEKERIYIEEAEREIATGDRICQDCKFVGTSNEFNRDIYDQELDDEIFDHPNLHIPKENLIKATCKELNLTYKQLGEAIGLSEGSIKRLATSDEINTQAIKSCEMLLEIKSLKERLSNTETLKTALKTLLD
ncbi:hypothetical protein [Campylobacter concisus]|uniref:hypothetical protein n=1 Tax=Campylobacter concisus TaxID=199 RepID=UPI001F16B605|nr:hypothetical protein [Campylobacter concisus]